MFAANAAHIFGRHHIVEVPFLATHAILEILGIMPAVEHAAVIVALNHEILGLPHVVVGAGRDDARVGSHHKLVMRLATLWCRSMPVSSRGVQ